MTTPEEQFVVGDTDLRYFEEHSCRTEGGAILFCRRGSATVTVDQLRDRVTRDTLLLLLPGSILHLNECTDDFRVRFCAFSLDALLAPIMTSWPRSINLLAMTCPTSPVPDTPYFISFIPSSSTYDYL